MNLKYFLHLYMRKYFTVTYSVKFSVLSFLSESYEKSPLLLKKNCLIFYHIIFLIDFNFTGCSCSIAKLCPTLCNPMDCSIPPGFPILHYLPEFVQTHVHCLSDTISVILSNHLILCCPLLLLLSIFPRIRVFPNELALHIKWPKDRSFSVSPSNEYFGLISFRIDLFAHLAFQWTLKNLLQHHNLKA